MYCFDQQGIRLRRSVVSLAKRLSAKRFLLMVNFREQEDKISINSWSKHCAACYSIAPKYAWQWAPQDKKAPNTARDKFITSSQNLFDKWGKKNQLKFGKPKRLELNKCSQKLTESKNQRELAASQLRILYVAFKVACIHSKTARACFLFSASLLLLDFRFSANEKAIPK